MKSSSQITTGENLTPKEQKLKTFVLSKIARLTSPNFADDIKGASMKITIADFTFVNVNIGHTYDNGLECFPILVKGWILNKDEKKQILENLDMLTENTPIYIRKFNFANTPSATSSSMIINYLKNKRDEKEQILKKSPGIAYSNYSYLIEINISYYAKAHNGLDINGGLIKGYGGIENLIKLYAFAGVDLESDIIKALEQETSLIGFNSNLISKLKEKHMTIPCDDRIFSPSELISIKEPQSHPFISIQESDQKSYQKSKWFISIQKSELDKVLYDLIGYCDDVNVN